ncbi:MAG: thioredoxin domain-containing protein, partial [Anaerolineales bacterium]
KPFFGGTYYPPVPRHRLPAFIDVLRAIHEAWTTKREQIEEATDQIYNALRQQFQNRSQTRSLEREHLKSAITRLLQTYDWQYGGWGKAPKFPQPIALEFLIRQYAQNPTLTQVKELIEHALKKMSQGGMYDLLEGGFCRYSTDQRWMIPHFEKMLYDNAQLGIVYLYAALVTKNESFLKVVEQTVAFLLQNMQDSSGLFYSSMDADSEGEEGKYYTFTLEELRKTLTAEEFETFSATHHLAPLESNPTWMVFQPIEVSDLNQDDPLQTIYAKLRHLRSSKVRPNIDDKCILSWNGLLLRFFAEASKYLDFQKFIELAKSLASAIRDWYVKDNTLFRIKRGDIVSTPALLEDYGAAIVGLLSLYEISGEIEWYELSRHLAHLMVEKFQDPEGGFFDASSEHSGLILKPKEMQDTSTPAANAMAFHALLKLSVLEGTYLDWLDRSTPFLQSLTELASHYPTSFSSWLILFDMILSEPKEVVLIGARSELQPFFEALWSSLRPQLVVCHSDLPLSPS